MNNTLHMKIASWIAALGCFLLLLSAGGVAKSGQNIGFGLLVLSLLAAGPGVWRTVTRTQLVWATAAWIAAITASMLYAAAVVGIPVDDQTRHLWRFSRLFLIPLTAWAVAFSRLGAHRAYVILFAGFFLGMLYYMAEAGWPWFFNTPGRVDISDENEQFYGMLSATAFLAAIVFGTTVHQRATDTWHRTLHYGFWGLVALAGIQGLLISLARGAFLALAVALTVWAGFQGLRIVKSKSVPWAGITIAVLLAATTTGALMFSSVLDHSISRVQRDIDIIREGADPETGFYRDRSIGIRLNHWEAAISGWRDHKMLGHGTDGSRHVRAQADLPERSARSAPHHFHNSHLDVLVRFGLVGIIAMALFFISYLRTVRSGNGAFTHPVTQFAYLATLIFLIAGITQTYWTSQVAWFYLAGALGPAAAEGFRVSRSVTPANTISNSSRTSSSSRHENATRRSVSPSAMSPTP